MIIERIISVDDRFFIIDGSTASFEISNVASTTPALSSVSVAAFTFTTVEETYDGSGVYTSISQPSYMGIVATEDKTTFELL